MLRIGHFGAGRIGRIRARILAAHESMELTEIYDIESGASAAAASETESLSVDSVDALP